jgi:hypothetical protein
VPFSSGGDDGTMKLWPKAGTGEPGYHQARQCRNPLQRSLRHFAMPRPSGR